MTLRRNGESKDLQSAVDLLQSLRPNILEILANNPLRVALNTMDIMSPDHGDLSKAHVLWLGPSLNANDDTRRLRAVCGLYPHRIKNINSHLHRPHPSVF